VNKVFAARPVPVTTSLQDKRSIGKGLAQRFATL
jgi:hypothetical protein